VRIRHTSPSRSGAARGGEQWHHGKLLTSIDTNRTKRGNGAHPIGRQTTHTLWEALRHRDYALLFWGQPAGTQMQVVAIAWQVLLLTKSPVALGLIGLAQGIPRMHFSLVGGVFADIFDRRRLLLVVNSLLACTSAMLSLCTIVHVVNVAIIYGMVLAASSVSAFESLTWQTVTPSLVPRERMADAMVLSTVPFQVTVIVDVAACGIVLALAGVANTYLLQWYSHL